MGQLVAYRKESNTRGSKAELGAVVEVLQVIKQVEQDLFWKKREEVRRRGGGGRQVSLLALIGRHQEFWSPKKTAKKPITQKIRPKKPPKKTKKKKKKKKKKS